MFIKNKLLIVFVSIAGLLFCTHVMSGSANASSHVPESVPVPVAPGLASLVKFDDQASIADCNNPFYVSIGSLNWFGIWVSPVTRPADISPIPVAFGTPLVQLQINAVTVNCHNASFSGGFINNYHTFVTGVRPVPGGVTINLVPGVTPGPPATSVFGPYAAGDSKGDWGVGTVPFDYYPTGGFTIVGTNTYTIYITSKQAYTRSDGTFGCAEDGSSIGSLAEVWRCRESEQPYSISVDVGPPSPPEVSITAPCSRTATGGLEITATITANPGPTPGAFLTSVGGSAAGVPLGVGVTTFAVPEGTSGFATAYATNNSGPTPVTASFAFSCPPNRPPVACPGIPGCPGGPTSVAGGPTGLSAVCGPSSRTLTVGVSVFVDPDGGIPVSVIALVPSPSGGLGRDLSAAGTYTFPDGVRSAPAQDGVFYTFELLAQDAQSGAWVSTSPPAIATYRCPRPAPVVSCSITGGEIELGSAYSPIVNVTSANNNADTINATARIDIAGAIPPTRLSGPQNVPANNISVPFSFPPGFTFPGIGDYTVLARANWPLVVFDDPGFVLCPSGGSIPGSTTVSVITLPYFKVLNGDIIAANNVRGWNRANPGYVPSEPSGLFGSGAQGSVLAQNNSVSGVASAIRRPTAPSPLRGLTFANTPLSLWGGNFGVPLGLGWSLPTTPTTATAPFNPPHDIGALASGVYESAGLVTTALSNIAPGSKVTIFSSHPQGFTIAGNITYPANYADITRVPRIQIIAEGDIFIAPGVTRVDAELISGGRIWTCGSRTWLTPAGTGNLNRNLVAEGCDNPLIINGSLSSRNGIKLTRIRGTLLNSQAGDATRVGSSYSNFASGTNNIAEIIQFAPEVYLTSPATEPPFPAASRYDAINALPPLF